MRVIETKVYKFDELSDRAKERAREWYREGALQYEWYDFTFEDFDRICKIIGIELDTYPVKLMNGSTRMDPKIYFQLSYSQGDGASFCGWYRYQKEARKKIREYCNDQELIRITDELCDMQRKHFYRMQCKVRDSRHYGVSVECDYDTPRAAEDCMQECMDDLCHWLYRNLRDECDYLMSDEAVDESIRSNEYEFDEDGGIA